ncbi:MAG: DUF4215 domain-containing protein [Myxococcota bacterium]
MLGFCRASSTRRLRVLCPWTIASGLAGLFLFDPVAVAAVVPGRIVLQEGDAIMGGAAVTEISPPWVNAAGEVGFTGELDNGDHYVFVGNDVVWQGNDDAAVNLDNVDSVMGSNGRSHWVYAVNINGNQGLYTDAGIFAVSGDSAPGFTGNFTFLSTPSMTADGTIYWRAGINTDDDGDTDERGFYRATDGTFGSAELLLASGDIVDGVMINDNSAGINASFAISDNGAHWIHVLNMEGSSDNDDFVMVDGLMVAREDNPTSEGDNWAQFDLVGINDAGNYLFTGDTNGLMNSDEFIAYNGNIAIREGDTVDGVLLPSSANLRFVAINNLEQATHAWGYFLEDGDARETVFFACNAADLAGTSQEVFTTIDDELDVDGDGNGDYAITNIPLGSATDSKSLGETPFVYVEVELEDGNTEANAIVEFAVTCCGNTAIDPREECDDGNDDDTDDCPSTCLNARCGDGFVQTGVEECDDGNDDDTDACRNDCTLPDSVDETVGEDSTSSTGGSGTGPGSASLGDTDSLGSSTTADDTNTDSGGGIVPLDSACGCRAGRPVPDILASLMGLGVLGLGRRRRYRR